MENLTTAPHLSTDAGCKVATLTLGLLVVPERAWARRLEGMVQTTAFGLLRDAMLSREEKHLDQT
jgi:hypothetical protein